MNGNEIKKLLGMRIKEIRRAKKMTQERLAERIGIEPNNVSMIEIGKNYPTPENLGKIASALNVEVYELFIFQHFLPVEEVKKRVISEILSDDKMARLVYKFCNSVKTM